MSEQDINSAMIRTLHSIEGISDIEVDIDDNDSPSRELVTGWFVYNEGNYSFSASENKTLVIVEVSYMFTFEGVYESNPFPIYEAVNNFNKQSAALKASIVSINNDDKELNIDFTYGLLHNPAIIGEENYDLEAGIAILSQVSTRMSELLTRQNITHNKIAQVNTEEEDVE